MGRMGLIFFVASLADVEMADGNQGFKSLKPVGRKMKKKIKIAKKKFHGKGKIRRKNI